MIQHTPKNDVEVPSLGFDSDLPDEGSLEESAMEEAKRKKLIWKIDMHILPFVVLLYLFSFLDRGESPPPPLLSLQPQRAG